MAAFCSGTLIETEDGALPIEELRIGQRVITLSGAAEPIKWIWRRRHNGPFTTGNRAFWPVRLTEGALAGGVPSSDLVVSPDHHIYLDGSFVRVRHLLNGATIIQAAATEPVEYFHLELAEHNAILAANTPGETFAGVRRIFADYDQYIELYGEDKSRDFPRYTHYLHWSAPRLRTIRRAIFRRAEELGCRLEPDRALRVIADGGSIPPILHSGGSYRFQIPRGVGELWLASRYTVPADVVPESEDARMLGAPVERIVMSDGALSIEKQHGDSQLSDGFHHDEQWCRWTDGWGRLPDAWLRNFEGPFTLEVLLAPSELPYLTPAEGGE